MWSPLMLQRWKDGGSWRDGRKKPKERHKSVPCVTRWTSISPFSVIADPIKENRSSSLDWLLVQNWSPVSVLERINSSLCPQSQPSIPNDVLWSASAELWRLNCSQYWDSWTPPLKVRATQNALCIFTNWLWKHIMQKKMTFHFSFLL